MALDTAWVQTRPPIREAGRAAWVVLLGSSRGRGASQSEARQTPPATGRYLSAKTADGLHSWEPLAPDRCVPARLNQLDSTLRPQQAAALPAHTTTARSTKDGASPTRHLQVAQAERGPPLPPVDCSRPSGAGSGRVHDISAALLRSAPSTAGLCVVAGSWEILAWNPNFFGLVRKSAGKLSRCKHPKSSTPRRAIA